MKKQLMDFKILNWNVAGAKYLEKEEINRKRFKDRLNDELNRLIEMHNPHVVTLQELVKYGIKRKDIIRDIEGYNYHAFPLIDTESLSVRAKWNKLERMGNWPEGTYFAQGNGFLFRDDLYHHPVMALPRDGRCDPMGDKENYIEKVGLESGLYFGDRDSEPRAALVAHFVFNLEGKPLDIFVINLHLTTLTMEREGVPEIDRIATNIRLAQLDIIFNGIISRYNSWWRGGFRERGELREPKDWESFDRYVPLWILTGDFNSTPESREYNAIQGFNFMDVVPTKVDGTKSPGAGNPATLTLDYVFAGPKFIALEPLLTQASIHGRVKDIRISDHFPMIANIPIWRRTRD